MLVEQNARFQHMIGKLLEAELRKELGEFAVLFENTDG